MKRFYIFLSLTFLYASMQAQATFNNTGSMQLHSNTYIAFYGNFSNSGTFTDNGTSTRFWGTVAQSISGSSVTTFRNLSVNNASGISLNQSANISNVLNLMNGPLSLNSHMLTISSGVPAALVRTNGYIISEQTNNSARLRWNIGSNAGAHEFPFATANGTYIPFTVNLTAGNIGNVTLATYPTAVNNMPYPPTVSSMVDSSGMDNSLNTADRFWQIDKDGPSGTATLTFTATPAEIGGIQYQLKARRWNTATQTWEAPLPGQTFTATSVTVPAVTAFSPWVIAGATIPLPIELLSFTAQVNERREVDLVWVTATEINNDYFSVERSQDLLNYETVSTQNGAGNSNEPLTYTDLDPRPYDGTSYYRLKQTDFDGSYSYSAPVSINLQGESLFSLTVFPNPTVAEHVYATLSGIRGKTLVWELENLAGQRLWNFTQAAHGIETLQQKLPLGPLPAGIYLLKVSDGPQQKTVRVIIY